MNLCGLISVASHQYDTFTGKFDVYNFVQQTTKSKIVQLNQRIYALI